MNKRVATNKNIIILKNHDKNQNYQFYYIISTFDLPTNFYYSSVYE